MRAAVLYKPLDLRLEERDIPKPEKNEIVIKVHTSGLCPSDVKIFRNGGFNVKYPVVLGHEVSGIVYEVGDGIEDFKKGDKVVVAADGYCGKCRMCRIGKENLCLNPLELGYNVDGGHADYMKVPEKFIERNALIKLPDWAPLDIMSLTEPLATAIHNQRSLDVHYEESELIIGDGPMGLLNVFAAKKLGVNKIAIIGLWEWKLNIAKKLGADYTYFADDPSLLEKIKRDFPDGFCGVTVTIPNEQTVDEALRLASKGCKVSIFAGLPLNNSRYIIDSNLIHYNELEIVGSYGYTYYEFELSSKYLLQNSDSIRQIVSHKFELSDIYAAIKTWDDKQSSLKILLSRKN